jgi:hypothetical protein
MSREGTEKSLRAREVGCGRMLFGQFTVGQALVHKMALPEEESVTLE